MSDLQRNRINIEGVVQGVGFRHFVRQAARKWGVSGWVCNENRGVVVEAEGALRQLAGFLWTLREDIPPLASISRFEIVEIPARGETGFVIRPSQGGPASPAPIDSDTSICPDCLKEFHDPADRRYRYPFIHCSNCGPRYTLATTISDFPMCEECGGEYGDPDSRRFHVHTNACPACGPRLALLDSCGERVEAMDPLAAVIDLLRDGKIVAVKGMGGYDLAVDAQNDAAVRELRRRRGGDGRPFVLMSYSSADILKYAHADERELRLLAGPERPIVLLGQRKGHTLSAAVAPRNRSFGVMLPSTPIHYLLLKETFLALVMTGAHLFGESILLEDDEAPERLQGIADAILSHDLRIHIPSAASIVRMTAGKAQLLRRSRGYIPRSIFLPKCQPSTLAIGGEAKSAVCLTLEDRAFLSQQTGDLRNATVWNTFEKTVSHLRRILKIDPRIIAHDLSPDRPSACFTESFPGARKVAVQHHHAHLASCLAENGVEGEAIGMIFDEGGYGADGRIWGGEFLVGNYRGFRRAGHFAYLPMPGGEAAIREPWRMALSCLHHAYGSDIPDLPVVAGIPEKERIRLLQTMEEGENTPLTSSCGRLFDAVAALCSLCDRVSYDGQVVLELEQAIEEGEEGFYPYDIDHANEGYIFQPAATIRAIVDDLQTGITAGIVSARFHNTLAYLIAETSLLLRADTGLNRVALSGSLFQNQYLTEKSVAILKRGGFEVLTHSLVPSNDGGLALGQAVVAGWQP